MLGLPSRARDSENVQEDLAVSVSSIVADLDNVAIVRMPCRESRPYVWLLGEEYLPTADRHPK